MKEIAKKQRCVLIRGGLEIWVDEEKVDTLMQAMQSQKLIDIDGEIVNTFEIVGVYTPDRVEEIRMNKQGKWKCKHGNWHDRHEKCFCRKVMGYETVYAGDQAITKPVYEN